MSAKTEQAFKYGFIQGIAYAQHMLQQTGAPKGSTERIRLLGEGMMATGGITPTREFDRLLQDWINRFAELPVDRGTLQ